MWATIGSCLPSLVPSLLDDSGEGKKDSQLRAACLITLQRVIPLPSNSSSALASGITLPICTMVWKDRALGKQALEVLHAMSQHKSGRVCPNGVSLVSQGAVRAACYALTSFPKSESLATKALEMLSLLLSDDESYTSENSSAIVSAVSDESNVVKVICASLGVHISREIDVDEDLFLNLYSKWKTMFKEKECDKLKKVSGAR